jgi:hypothetical protein
VRPQVLRRDEPKYAPENVKYDVVDSFGKLMELVKYLLRNEVEEQANQFKKLREQVLGSTHGIFDQVRKASQALGDTRLQFERLTKASAFPASLSPSIETKSLEFNSHMAEYNARLARERSEDREMVRLTGQMTAQSAETLQELAAGGQHHARKARPARRGSQTHNQGSTLDCSRLGHCFRPVSWGIFHTRLAQQQVRRRLAGQSLGGVEGRETRDPPSSKPRTMHFAKRWNNRIWPLIRGEKTSLSESCTYKAVTPSSGIRDS